MKPAICYAMIVALVPLCSFAEGLGGAGPGGGDASHVQEQASQHGSRFADKMAQIEEEANRAQALKQAKRAAEKEKEEALITISPYSHRVDLYLKIFLMVDYPFSKEFKKNIDPEKLFNTHMSVYAVERDERVNFRVDNSIAINGKPVTFLSTPNLQNSGYGKLAVNAKLFVQQEQDLKSWSIIATVFHELLRLQNLEGSDSYPYTTEFAMALRDAFENPQFTSITKKLIMEGCPAKETDYSALSLYADWALETYKTCAKKLSDEQFLKDFAKDSNACLQYTLRNPR